MRKSTVMQAVTSGLLLLGMTVTADAQSAVQREPARALAYESALSGVERTSGNAAVTMPARRDAALGEIAVRDSVRKPYTSSTRLVARSSLGGLGWVGGAIVGAIIGSRFQPVRCTSSAPCGSDNTLAREGAAIGGALAATAVVGSMALRDGCGRAARTGLALAGAAAGVAASWALVRTESSANIGALTVPVATIVGSSAASLYACRR